MSTVDVSRWVTAEPTSTHTLGSSYNEHLISLCLRATRLELRTGASAVFDGVMRAGALHVTGPGRQITAHFSEPCDILHLRVSTSWLQTRLTAIGAVPATLGGLAGCTLSDPLVEQLAKLLLCESARADTIYTTAIVQTILTRILHLAQDRAPVGALAKWRLRRVQAMVDARLAEPLTLNDMAAVAGLSRMHFAAQFRTATGSSPHEYLLCRRIEAAKVFLAESETSVAEIALDVGFFAQAHFTTVFKRLAGETPGRWRSKHRAACFPVFSTPDLARYPGDSATLHE